MHLYFKNVGNTALHHKLLTTWLIDGMIGKPGKHPKKQKKKRLRFRLESPWPCTSFVLRLRINCIIAMLLLVSCMSTQNYIWYFAMFREGWTPKIAKKNIQQRTLSSFVTILFFNYVYQNCILPVDCAMLITQLIIPRKRVDIKG